jgi:hypothetical protein
LEFTPLLFLIMHYKTSSPIFFYNEAGMKTGERRGLRRQGAAGQGRNGSSWIHSDMPGFFPLPKGATLTAMWESTDILLRRRA